MNPDEINHEALERLIYAVDMPLIEATKKRDIIKVKKLLEEGYLYIDFQDKLKATALFYASKKGYSDIAKLLIVGGAKLDMVNIDGETPLHSASYYGHIEVVKQLIGAKANVNLMGQPLFL